MSLSPPPGAQEERVDAGRYAAAIVRHLPLVLALAVVFAALVFVVTRSLPERYDATATVALQGIDGGDGGDVEAARRRLATASALVTTPSVVTSTARRVGIDPEDAERALSSRVEPASNVIEITAREASPAEAMRLADTAVEVFLAVRRAGIHDSLARAQARVRGELTRLEAAGGSEDVIAELGARLADLQVRSAVAGEDLLSLRRATAPDGPASPRPVLNAFVAFLVAMIALCLLLVGREALRGRVSIRELERRVGAPVVAALGRERRRGAATREDGTARLALEAWMGPGHVVVVSSGIGDSWTGSTVGRLGEAFAQAGHDVLLVDAHLDRPSLHHRYRLPLDSGLTRLLERLVQGRAVSPQQLRRAARTVERAGGGKGRLAVLTTGEPVADQGRLLTVDGLQRLARLLRESDADCVLVHAPPIRQAAESWVLSREADALLLVVAADRARADDAAELADVVQEITVPSALLAVQDDGRSPHVRVRTRPTLPARPRLRLARATAGEDRVQDAEQRRSLMLRAPGPTLRPLGGAAAASGALLLAAVVTSVALTAAPLPAPLLLAAAVGLAAVVWLVLARFDVAVLAGVLLFGVVRVEPAPTDALLAVAMAVAILTRRPELRRVPLWAAVLVALLVLGNLLSLLSATDLMTGGRYMAITVYLLVLALWLAAYVDRMERARALVLAYGAAAVVSATLGSLALIAPIPARGIFLLEGCCRAQGLFEDPNVFGPFLIPALLIFLHEALQPRLLSPRRRPWLIAAVVLLQLGVVLSFSRGAWLNLAVGLVVMMTALAIRPGGASRAVALGAVMAAVTGAALGALSLTGETAYLNERANVQSYDSMRFAMQDKGLQVASSTPLGIGPGQVEVEWPLNPHNVYILVGAEQGALGILAFGALILGTVGLGVRNVLAGRDTYGIASGALLGAWCGLLASGFFVDTLHWRHLWFVAALIWAAGLRRPRGARRGRLGGRGLARTLAPVALLLAALAIAVPAALSGPTASTAGTVPADGPAAAGDVRFMQYPNSSFDRFVKPRYAAFANEKYWRLRTYSPFFDPALRWYKNAWVYHNVQAIYPRSDWARENPEWILRDARGSRLFVPWGCARGTCPQYAADIGDPAFRRAWLRSARQMLDQGYRGLYLDDVNMTRHVGDGSGRRVTPIDERTGRPMTEATWRRYMAEFTELIRRTFPGVEITHNLLWAYGEADPLIGRQIAAADYINLERGVTDDGLTGGTGTWAVRTLLAYVDRIHARGRPVMLEGRGTDVAGWEYNLAAYFLISTGRDAVGGVEGGTPVDWWEGYDVRLGAPAGPRVDWQGLIRRDFERGVVLLNEPDGPTLTVDPGPGLTRVDGTPVTTVQLGPASGAVLLRP